MTMVPPSIHQHITLVYGESAAVSMLQRFLQCGSFHLDFAGLKMLSTTSCIEISVKSPKIYLSSSS